MMMKVLQVINIWLIFISFLLLGECVEKDKDYDVVVKKLENDIVKDMESLLKKYPSNTKYRVMVATIYILMGKYGKAYFILNKIKDRDRNNIINFLFYWIFSSLNMEKEAHEVLNKIKSKYVPSLELKNTAFCKSVKFFGVYEEFPNYVFCKGQNVLIYTEIHNFLCSKKEDKYCVDITQGLSVVSSGGIRIWYNDNLKRIRYFSKSKVNDLYTVTRFYIPYNTYSGEKYYIEIKVKDNISGQIATSRISFKVR